MKYLRHAYSKKCFVVCLKFKLNWMCWVLPGNLLSLTFLYTLLLTHFFYSLPHMKEKEITFVPSKNSSRSWKDMDIGEKS